MNLGNGCSIVLIDGKYLEMVDEVMKKVDDITEEIDFMPYAAFLMDDNVKINTTLRDIMINLISKTNTDFVLSHIIYF